MRRFPSALLALLVVLAPTTASAEDEPSRRGFIVGVTAGVSVVSVGSYQVDDETGPFLEARVGHMVHRDVAIFVQPAVTAAFPPRSEQADEIDISTLRAGAQYWPRDRLWLSGSVGVGWLSMTERVSTCPPDELVCFDYKSVELDSAIGPTAAATIGVDLYQRPSFGIELQASIHGVAAGDSSVHGTAFSLGVHWY